MNMMVNCSFCRRSFYCEPTSAGAPPHACVYVVPVTAFNEGYIEYGVRKYVSNAVTVRAEP